MFCPNCGAQAADGASFCTECGTPLNGRFQSCPQTMNLQNQPFPQAQMNAVQYVSMETYLVHNILATIFCFFPVGIAGLVFSILAKNALSNGNIQAAKSNADVAKVLFWVSFGVGALIVPVALLALI